MILHELMDRILSYSYVSFFFSKLVSVLIDMVIVLAIVFFLAACLQFLFFSPPSTDFSFSYPTNAYTSVSLFGGISENAEASLGSHDLRLVGTMILSNGHSVAVISNKDGYTNTNVITVGGVLPDGSVLSEVGIDHAIVDDHGKKFRLEAVSDQSLISFTS